MKICIAAFLLIFPSLASAGNMPKMFHPHLFGTGTACNRGYYQSGQQCLKVVVPENAGIDIFGNGWTCNRGYKKASNACIPMTEKELQKQKEFEQALASEMRRRRVEVISGDDCETEYHTNSTICAEVTGGDLSCREGYDGTSYRACDVSLSYDIKTDYTGDSYINVEVECTVEIEYKGRQTYVTQSDSSSEDESHTLYAQGRDSDNMDFAFSFSSYKEITSVKISSAACEIESVYLP